MNDNNATQVDKFVFRRLTESFQFLNKEVDGFWWVFILGVILVIGIVYVVWMYVRDGRTIGWVWGSLLAVLRLAVYAVLAAVFLLPAIQHWEETKTQSRVVLAFDSSLSLRQTRDDYIEGVPFDRLPTRTDKVVKLFTQDELSFLKRLLARNPVVAYRWGLGVDEEFKVFSGDRVWDRKEFEEFTRNRTAADRPQGREITPEEITAWLQVNEKLPDDAPEEQKREFLERQDRLNRLFAGTNVGDSSLGVLTREMNNMVQGLVIFTDGRSTQTSRRAFDELAERAKRNKVPVFVVAVGRDRQPVRIDIADARGPDVARPEDPFPISVDVNGEGLAGRDVTIYLDVFKPGQDHKKDQPFRTLEKKEKFRENTQPPRAQAEFPITPADFGEEPKPREEKPDDKKPDDKPSAGSGKPELAEGEWKFVVRVPKDKEEIFAGKEHVRDPVTVKVIKRPLRMLLFASAPTRDFQFINAMMLREMDKKRLELSIYMQAIPGQPRRTGIVLGVPPDRMLTRFPDRLDTQATGEAVYNLANYDVIIAFDPDWNDLSAEQANMLKSWIDQQGGGLIIVAGPIHTLELARPGAGGGRPGADPEKLKPIREIYPVVLKDSRLEKERNTADPVRLRFPGANPEMEFLKLDEENPNQNPLTAWEEFFMGPNPKEAKRPVRGFYGFYPVQKAKDGCITVATFSDPQVQDAAGREQPYLVIQPNFGKGRVVWLGSGETWRLRQYREVWHERFWTKLARYASSGSVGQTVRRIIPNVGRVAQAGKPFDVEAKMFGNDLKPLSEKARPTLRLIPPVGVNEKDIPAELREGRFEMKAKDSPGEWEGWFKATLVLAHPGEYQLEMRLPDSNETASVKFSVVEVNQELENTRPDFDAIYDLASEADDVLARLDDQTRAEVKKALTAQRLVRADRPGEKPSAEGKEQLRLVFDLETARWIPDCMLQRQDVIRNLGGVDDLWDRGVTLWTGTKPDGTPDPVQFSYVLGLVVGLLSIEWLTRKLLRLA